MDLMPRPRGRLKREGGPVRRWLARAGGLRTLTGMRVRQACLLLLIVPAAWAADSLEYWVSPAGSDGAAGTRAQPFATLERARDAVRQKRASVSGGAVVRLLPGVHVRSGSFELTAEDGGSVSAPVTYRAEGEVILRAGTTVPAAAFRPVSDPKVLARLDPAAKGRVLELDLKPLGLRNARRFPDIFVGGGGLIEIYFEGQRMPLSRWPNVGNTTMAKVLDRGDWTAKPGRAGVFLAREDRLARWKVEEGLWLEGYWRVPWSPSVVRVAALDAASRKITFAVPVAGGIGSKYAKAPALGDGKEPWCALNVLEEIDRPGEWCVDFAAQRLYFWAPGVVGASSVTIADMAKPMIALRGTAAVTIRGLIFEQGLGNGVEIDGGTDNLVAGCLFRALGGNGAVVRGGSRNGIRSSDFHDLGEAGILLSGGDRATLAPCGNFAENNHLHHLGIRRKTYAAGIHVGAFGAGPAVGCRVSHNYIHDLPHAGVLYGGNDHLFEFNEVSRVVLTSADMGAFYTTNDWTSRGNVVRHNFVHSSPRANAFYMDDGDSGDLVEGNVCHGMFYGPFIGGGHDNIIRHNLVIACERGLHVDARGIARGYDKDKGLLRGLAAVPYQQAPWNQRYPTLPGLLAGRPEYPGGNRVTGNAVVACRQPLHLSRPKDLADSKVEGNVVFALPAAGLKDPAQADFTLRPDSAVFAKISGFPVIPFALIGLRRDEYRRELPRREFGPAADDGEVFDSDTDIQRTNQAK